MEVIVAKDGLSARLMRRLGMDFHSFGPQGSVYMGVGSDEEGNHGFRTYCSRGDVCVLFVAS